MKINARSLKFVNHLAGNRAPPILFYVPRKKEKLSHLDYQVYKLWSNPKDKKLDVYSLTVKYYKVGTPKEWLQFINAISQSLLRGDALQIFQNEEAHQAERDGPEFTKCLAAITKHVFPNKVYNTQKKYIQNICKLLRLGSCKWISRIIKLNDYLVNFPVLEGVTATKLSCKEVVDILEDGVLLQ
eukprot:13342557-Ditylum_brightwellii.AAC.2